MAITLADFTKIWASTSPLTPYSFSDANYQEGWNFVGATPPARQMWDFLQKQNDEKLKYIVDNYLPTAGGTMTGAITTSTVDFLKKTANDSHLTFMGGTAYSNSASLSLWGGDSTAPGEFRLRAQAGSGAKELTGNTDGMLTWDGIRIAFEYLGSASNGVATNFTLPSTGWWLVVCGHNSTAGLNGIFAVRTGGNTAFKLAGAGNITMTCSGATITVTPSDGAVQVACLQLPTS